MVDSKLLQHTYIRKCRAKLKIESEIQHFFLNNGHNINIVIVVVVSFFFFFIYVNIVVIVYRAKKRLEQTPFIARHPETVALSLSLSGLFIAI